MAEDQIIHNFEGKQEMQKSKIALKVPLVFFLILAILGIGTGYIVAQTLGPSVIPIGTSRETGKLFEVKQGQIFGSKDEKTFKDSVEGTLRKGGIDGEGAYHLERPGGESQNVYLTSSIIDLSQFLEKKVKVWGETFEAEKAGWLMDVGRLQLL